MADARRHPALLPLLVFAAVIALVAALKLIPTLLRDTTPTSGTPVRRELIADAALGVRPAQRLCLDDVAFETDGSLALLYLRSVETPGAELRTTAIAPGYRAAGQVRLAPRSQREGGLEVTVPLTPPARATAGRFCVENRGPGAFELIGSADPRALTRTRASLDGRPLQAAFSLRLLDAHRRSLLARSPQLADRAAALSAFGPWLYWVLVPLLALGLPLLVGAALWLSLREPDPASGAEDGT